MAYDEKSLVNLKHLKTLATKLNSEIDDVNERIDEIVTVGGEPNVITSIKVNGVEQTITDKSVDITVPTKVSDLTNDSGYQTENDVKNAIKAQVGSAYQAGGSVDPDNLPELTDENVGLVVNVTDPFVTDTDFLDGAGNEYPAGTNVVIIKQGEDIKYDVLSGFVDLSNYVEKETGKGLSTNDFTNDYKAKLDAIAANATKVEASDINGNIKIDGVETTVYTLPDDVIQGDIATDAEVTEMLNEVFPSETN